MAWKLAPSLVQLRAEINAKYPGRDKASDGSVGDAAHSSRTSDHNPDARGIVHAVDIDKDLFPGSDAQFNALVEKIANDPRIKYTIWRRRIKNPGQPWRKYTGTNPHDKHAHFSVTVAGENQTHSWLGTSSPSKPAQPITERLTAGQIKGLAQSVGIPPDELSLATAIALAESSGNPRAYNGKGLDASYGLWQINTHGNLGPDRRAKLGLKSNDELFDPVVNARAMKLVRTEAGANRWKPWGAFTDGRYLEYWEEARQAVATPSTMEWEDDFMEYVTAEDDGPLKGRVYIRNGPFKVYVQDLDAWKWWDSTGWVSNAGAPDSPRPMAHRDLERLVEVSNG